MINTTNYHLHQYNNYYSILSFCFPFFSFEKKKKLFLKNWYFGSDLLWMHLTNWLLNTLETPGSVVGLLLPTHVRLSLFFNIIINICYHFNYHNSFLLSHSRTGPVVYCLCSPGSDCIGRRASRLHYQSLTAQKKRKNVQQHAGFPPWIPSAKSQKTPSLKPRHISFRLYSTSDPMSFISM